jgi:hypothetical protein
MKASRLSMAIFFIAALLNPFYANAGSADENEDQGTIPKPVSKPEPECENSSTIVFTP